VTSGVKHVVEEIFASRYKRVREDWKKLQNDSFVVPIAYFYYHKILE